MKNLRLGFFQVHFTTFIFGKGIEYPYGSYHEAIGIIIPSNQQLSRVLTDERNYCLIFLINDNANFSVCSSSKYSACSIAVHKAISISVRLHATHTNPFNPTAISNGNTEPKVDNNAHEGLSNRFAKPMDISINVPPYKGPKTL